MPKNSITGAENSLKCKNFGQFNRFHPNKSGKNEEDSHFRIFLEPGIEFLGKNTSQMVDFKIFERIIFSHFLTNFSINRHMKVVEG